MQGVKWAWHHEEMKRAAEMDEGIDPAAPVIQPFTPVNQPLTNSINPLQISSTATKLVERPTKKTKPVGNFSTVAGKSRKRKGTEIEKLDSVIVKAPKTSRVRRPRPSTSQKSLDKKDVRKAFQRTKPGETMADSKGTKVDDEFSHADDDEFPMSDLEDYFEVDCNGKEQRIANNSDVLICEDVEAIAQDHFADEDLDIELLNLSIPSDVDALEQDPFADEGLDIELVNLSILSDVEAPAQDPFADEDLDIELLNLSVPSLDCHNGHSSSLTQRTPPRSPVQKAPTLPYSSCKTAVRAKFIPDCREAPAIVTRMPLSPISSPNTTPHQISFASDGRSTPVFRPPFPASVLACSPVKGLSSKTVLRTCFRIGQALSAASSSLRNSIDAVIELYCCVKHSDREPNGYKQFFELEDLFKPDGSPILNAVYAIWKGVELWEIDSRAFLGDGGRGKMARVMGRMKRREGGQGWEMTVLNIWEATWEDVGVVKGIVCT